MRTARRWIAHALLVSMMVGLACSTSSEEEPIATKEIARQEVGPAGGTVTGGAVTIEIPEGALLTTKTIVINEAIDPNARRLPVDTQIAGGLYVLQPDDITFAKPVTITVRIDESKKRNDGKGALVLFRGTGANAWTPYGADETTATAIVGKTTHFSVWAPTAAVETYCYLNQCSSRSRVRPDATAEEKANAAGVLPALDCKVPNVGDKGVLCAGTAPDKGPPYECHCVGSDVSLGTWPRLPPDTAITAMAQQCGAPACPPKPTFACDLGLVCEDGPNGWTCSTGREPRVLCNGGAGGASCSCTTGTSFGLPNTSKLTNDDLVAAWQANCGGSCENAGTDPNTEWVCPGSTQTTDPSGKCIVETAGTCRDNHVYRAECAKPEGTAMPTCTCMVDGVATKTVTALCVETAFVCDFPKTQGDTTSRSRGCPRVTEGPMSFSTQGPEQRPEGCLTRTGGPCRDGHIYSAECPTEGAPCTCKVDGVGTRAVNVPCHDTPAACGFPPSE